MHDKIKKSSRLNIPIFPKYKKLELSDKNKIEARTKKFPPYSDYNFVSLWGYDTEKDFRISQLYNNIIIRFRDYITNEPFYSFLGNTKVITTIQILLERSHKKNILPILKLIPKTNLLRNKKIFEEFHVKEDRDSFDYILSIDKFCALKGEEYKSHRKIINKFNKLYPHCTTTILPLEEKNIQKQMLNLFFVWEKQKMKKRKDTLHELQALKRILVNPKYLQLFSMGLYDDKNLISFQIVDLANPIFAGSHFFKSNYIYDGATHVLRYYISLELRKLGYKYINIQQDLGIEGLRKKKMSWRPINFLKKYTISAK